VVDPIDGTANFVRGVARFCVSVAFVAGGTIELGAIFSPVTDELFLARRGRGATLNGKPIRAAGTDQIERASIEIGWSSRRPYASYLEVVERMLAAGIDFRRFHFRNFGLRRFALGGVLVAHHISVDLFVTFASAYRPMRRLFQ
jgi:myo-inositol-1(or 4)-monophosphatase